MFSNHKLRFPFWLPEYLPLEGSSPVLKEGKEGGKADAAIVPPVPGERGPPG